MLLQNIWVDMGLVNGATSIIEDIVQKEGADVKKDLPQALLVAVDRYNGPTLFTSSNGKRVVPIFPTFREWEGSKGTCSRRQFPIVLAFALTIHKSQGLTLDRAVLDISRKERTTGLTYVGVSRVKKLSGLIFERGFDKELFNPTAGANKQARQRDFERRHRQLLRIDFP